MVPAAAIFSLVMYTAAEDGQARFKTAVFSFIALLPGCVLVSLWIQLKHHVWSIEMTMRHKAIHVLGLMTAIFAFVLLLLSLRQFLAYLGMLLMWLTAWSATYWKLLASD